MSSTKGFNPTDMYFGTDGDDGDGSKCSIHSDNENDEDYHLRNIPTDYDDIDFNNMDAELLKFQQDAVVQEALLRTVDLNTYYANIQSELATVEEDCLQDYISQAEMLADLYNQMNVCETTLSKMEGMLDTFQGDLSVVSSRIRDLQTHSMSIGVKLTNRKYVDKQLSSFLTRIYIPPDLINLIMRGDALDAAFCGAVESVYKRVVFCNTYHQVIYSHTRDLAAQVAGSGAALDHVEELSEGLRPLLSTRFPLACLDDVVGVLTQLYHRCLNRIVKGLYAAIDQLRRPQVSIPLKQTLLLRSRACYRFLLLHRVASARSPHQASVRSGLLLEAAGAVVNVAASATGAVTGAVSDGVSRIERGIGVQRGNRESECHGELHAPGFIDMGRYHALSEDIASEYVHAMSGTYLGLFSAYLSVVGRVCEDPRVGEADVLGEREAPVKRSGLMSVVRAVGGGMGLSNSAGKPTVAREEDRLRPFCIGQRGLFGAMPQRQGLEEASLVDISAISKPSTAEGAYAGVLVLPGDGSHRSLHPFERVFASCLTLLADTAIQEYSFLNGFFGTEDLIDGVGGEGAPRDAGDTAASSPSSPSSTASTASAPAAPAAPAPPVTISALLARAEASDEDEDTYLSALAAVRNFRYTQQLEGDDQPAGARRPSAADGPSLASEEASARADSESLYLRLLGTLSTAVYEAHVEALARVAQQQHQHQQHDTYSSLRGDKSAQRALAGIAAGAAAGGGSLYKLQPGHLLEGVLSKICSLYYAFLEARVSRTWDSLELLCVLRGVEFQSARLQARGITQLNVFLERCGALLWSRFGAVADHHLRSLRAAGSPAAAAAAAQMPQPHAVTLRCAEYLSAVRLLCGTWRPEAVKVCMVRLTGELHWLLDALSDARGTGQAKQACLINDIDAIVKTLISKGLYPSSPPAADSPAQAPHELVAWRSALATLTARYVEQAVAGRFPDLVQWVRGAEQVLRAGPVSVGSTVDGVSFAEQHLERLVTRFSQCWRGTLAALAEETQQAFTDTPALVTRSPSLFAISAITAAGAAVTADSVSESQTPAPAAPASTDIHPAPTSLSAIPAWLQPLALPLAPELSRRVLLQVALYYKRFCDALTAVCGRRQPIFMRELVPVQAVMLEVRRHTQATSNNR